MSRASVMSALLLAAVALTTELVVLLSVTGPLRLVVGLLFVLAAPGWAVLRLMKLPMDPTALAATAVAISISIDILITMALFYAGWWSVELATSILAGAILLLIFVDAPPGRRAVSRILPAPKREVAQP